ncbi:DNA-binding protein, excisionase family, partial [Idiomarina sp. A28L]|uniref:helix-turn-helix domain-containing protein n=1 Tax=Idiomarina sp. A28L TaxID=1036674 RepID=UPI00021385F7
MSVNHATMSGNNSRHSHDTKHSLLTIKEAADVAGVTERTINRLIASHEIQSMKSGKHRLIWRESLLTWKR